MTRAMDIPGVNDIWFNIERRTATISYNPSLTCPDSIKAPFAGQRYNMTPYNPADSIIRNMGLRMELTDSASARRAITTLNGRKGIDSLAPHLNRRYLFIRYDANRISKNDIKKLLIDAGFTPTSYYTSDKVGYALFNIPRGKNLKTLADDAIAFDGVEDVCVNPTTRKIAFTYFKDTTSEDKLRRKIK
jgi:heavy metal-associated domain protein